MDFISGNVFVRKNPLRKAGDYVNGHKHNFDHTTIVFKGAVHVKAKLPNGTVTERDFVAPTHFLVRKDVEHEIIATVDDTEFWCVYAHRTVQGEVSQIYTGFDEAYN